MISLMITRWRLTNFKSIREPLELELAPITVLSGLNSSGKSSVLQSIRLVAQTLRSPSTDRQLVLNGYDVMMGDMLSLLNSFSRQESLTSRTEPVISIGFDLNTSHTSSLSADPTKSSRLSESDTNAIPLSVKFDVDFQADFRRVGHRTAPNTFLFGGKLEIQSPESLFRFAPWSSEEFEEESVPIRHALLRYGRLSRDDEVDFLASLSPSTPPYLINRRGGNYFADISVENRDYPTSGRRLLLLAHFLPKFVVQSFLVSEKRRQQTKLLVSLISLVGMEDLIHFNEMFQMSAITPHRLAETKMPPALSDKVNQLLQESLSDAPTIRGSTMGEYLAALREQILFARHASYGDELVNSVADEFLGELLSEGGPVDQAISLEIVTNDPIVDALTEASNRTIDYFLRNIRYLGPLRLDPTEAQSFSPASEPDDVGPKGEFAAVVFEANAEHVISWWNPFSRSVESGRLRAAVSTWLDYLGVAKRALVSESPAVGVGWRVRVGRDHIDRPLASVGVGVSQVLPILIAGLLAPVGALLLIEQPELHLHPRAQSRLSEFFWGLSLTGRRCLIETHSEALVNGFRLLLVESQADASEPPVSMYFSHLSDGGSVFERVRVGTDGLIENWPEGFFDENHVLEDRITSSAIRARAKL